MRRFIVPLGLLVALFGCKPPCEPGQLWPMAKFEQSLARTIAPIPFQMTLGFCEPGDVPVPTAQATGPSGRTIRATIMNFDPSAVDLQWRSMMAAVRVAPIEAGKTRIDVVFPGATRSFEVEFIDALSVPRDFEIPGRCNTPVRVGSDGITCTNGVIHGQTYAYEASDGGVTQLEEGSQLWATPEGYLVALDGGLGWLADGQRLENWVPATTGLGDIYAVDATPEHVCVLTETELLLLDPADLSRVKLRAFHGLQQLGPFPTVIAAGSRVRVDVDYWRTTYDHSDGGLLKVSTEMSYESTQGTWGGLVWRCGMVNASPRVKIEDFGAASSEPLFYAEQGSCTGGDGHSDRPAFSNSRLTEYGGSVPVFFRCPEFDGGQLSFVSIDPQGGESGVGCFGDYMLIHTEVVPEKTVFIDLRKFRAR